MDFDFVIPLKKEDLLIFKEGHYFPKKTDLSVAWKKIGDCKKAVGDRGSPFILDYFDILFSILYEPQDVTFEQLQETWDNVIYILLQDLCRLVQEGVKNEDKEKRKYYLNTCMMSIYIFSMFFKTYEEKLSYNADNLIVDKKSKTKSKLTKYDTVWDWNNAKRSAFSEINRMLQENIHTLWDPPIAEDKFINIIAGCCYKAFENPEIIQVKLKPLKDSISQVLAILVNQYNHSFTFLPQCIQLLKSHEHSAAALANAVVVMVVDYKCSTLLPKIMREITEEVRDDEIQGFGKSVATFITTISEVNVEILLPTVLTLSKCLAYEPYVMRNAVLITFCELLLKSFTPPEGGEIPIEDKKLRNNLLKFLQNHLRDQSSYVRSKVLQLWAKLAASHAIPVEFFIPVLRTAKNRLTDSSSHVVKNAIQLFTAVLKDNIYAGKFNLSDLKNELAKAKEALKNIQSKQIPTKAELWNSIEPNLALKLNVILEGQNTPHENGLTPSREKSDVPIADTITVISQLLQKNLFVEAFNLLRECEIQYPDSQEIRCNMDRSDEVEYYIATFKKMFFNCTSYNPFAAELEQKKLVISYYEDTIAFTLLIFDVSKEIERPLFCQSTMEASEAIEFFTTAYQFSAGDSKRIVKQMIVLVWSRVPGIKEAVTAAYKTLYLESSQPTPKGKAMQAANRLIKLLKDLDQEQKAALEELIHNWVQENYLTREFIQVLWEIFSNKLPQFSSEDRTGALILLDIIAQKNPRLVSLNLQVLIDNGLSASNNISTVEYTCNMIAKLSEDRGDNGKFIRLSPEHEIFKLSSNIICEKFVEAPLNGFISLGNTALKMIYKVCSNPLQVADNLLESLYNIMKEDSEKNQNETKDGSVLYDEALLTPFLSIFGESILRKWLYFDKDVFNSLKKETNFNPNLNTSLEEEIESENQEAANEALTNSINAICEECLDIENSLDAHLRKLVVKVCFAKSCSVSLQTAAVATLAKLMMISSSFCENNIQILVTLMEKSAREPVRANAVLGFGDLIMRFPNILDPWTQHLYARLKDNSVVVRTHTVVVLCHLITREMVKVRGQLAELCLCLEDPDPSIAARVRYLLKNLSQKGNTLYNVIPDIISRLSNPERDDPVPTQEFNRVLKYVLGLIGKERQNDLLVEKLCVRLREAEDENQWTQLSFCLSQLSYSEKSLKKLIEVLPTLNIRLHFKNVYSVLEGIFTSASKSHFSKPQYKELAMEGLSKLEDLVTARDPEEHRRTGSVAEVQSKSQEGRGKASPGRDSDGEEVFVEPKTPRVPRTEPRPQRSAARSAKKTPARPPTSETPRSRRNRPR